MRKEKGITLVALVVTVVILLILAGVSLNLILGDQGLIRKANEGRTNYTNASKEEQALLDYLSDQLDEYAGSSEEIPDTETITSNGVLIGGLEDDGFFEYGGKYYKVTYNSSDDSYTSELFAESNEVVFIIDTVGVFKTQKNNKWIDWVNSSDYVDFTVYPQFSSNEKSFKQCVLDGYASIVTNGYENPIACSGLFLEARGGNFGEIQLPSLTIQSITYGWVQW